MVHYRSNYDLILGVFSAGEHRPLRMIAAPNEVSLSPFYTRQKADESEVNMEVIYINVGVSFVDIPSSGTDSTHMRTYRARALSELCKNLLLRVSTVEN